MYAIMFKTTRISIELLLNPPPYSSSLSIMSSSVHMNTLLLSTDTFCIIDFQPESRVCLYLADGGAGHEYLYRSPILLNYHTEKKHHTSENIIIP